MTLQPRAAFVFSDGFEAPADGILADDLLHAQQLGQNRVVTQRRDVGITLVPGQNREHRCAKHIALLRRVRARIAYPYQFYNFYDFWSVEELAEQSCASLAA